MFQESKPRIEELAGQITELRAELNKLRETHARLAVE